MRKPVVAITVVIVVFSCGCQTVPLLTEPTRHEKKIPAEFDLPAQEDKKVAVIVDNPVWVNAPAWLARQVGAQLTGNLSDELELPAERIISYEKVQIFRADKPEARQWSPVELGKAVGGDLVLFAEFHKFSLAQVTETEYYKGELAGRVALFDCASGQQLWPGSEQGKSIRVAFDVEEGDYNAANERLARAFAHCVTRHLYDCPVPKFKIFEDKSGTGWQEWQD